MSRVITRCYSKARPWAGIHIDPKEFGPRLAKREGKTVNFLYYDFSPFCNERSLTFTTTKEAEEFVKWSKRAIKKRK